MFGIPASAPDESLFGGTYELAKTVDAGAVRALAIDVADRPTEN